MKKLFLISILTIIGFTLRAQITLEHTYASSNFPMSTVKLANSGVKYYFWDKANNQVKLYNLDHSIFKTITYPSIVGATSKLLVYISETLFDLDNEVELMIGFGTGIATTSGTRVINEDGTIIFEKLGESLIDENSINMLEQIVSVVNTSVGTKLILFDMINQGYNVYALPGVLPAQVKKIKGDETEGKMYPNPANNYFKYQYRLSEGKSGILFVYDNSGKTIRNAEVDGNFEDIYIDTTAFLSGTYTVALYADGKLISSQKAIIVK
jgi:hypothetical protein